MFTLMSTKGREISIRSQIKDVQTTSATPHSVTAGQGQQPARRGISFGGAQPQSGLLASNPTVADRNVKTTQGQPTSVATGAYTQEG